MSFRGSELLGEEEENRVEVIQLNVRAASSLPRLQYHMLNQCITICRPMYRH